MLIQEQINEIIKAILKNVKRQKIILFGSYAHGAAREESDLQSRTQKRKVSFLLDKLLRVIVKVII